MVVRDAISSYSRGELAPVRNTFDQPGTYKDNPDTAMTDGVKHAMLHAQRAIHSRLVSPYHVRTHLRKHHNAQGDTETPLADHARQHTLSQLTQGHSISPDGDLYHGSTDIGAGAANFANEAPGVVELVRHVRSPAGVAFFKKPIGTPITEAEYDAIKAEHAAAMRSHAADLRGSGNSSAASALERAAESVQRSRATSPGTLSRANEQLYNASAALGRDMSQSDKQRIAQEHIENVESLGRYSRLGTPFELPGDRTAEAKSRGRQATSAREVRPADSRSEFLAAASMPSESQLKAADNYDAYGFPLKKSVSEPSKESSSAHSDLLAARKAARAKYPAGHPERLKAERAVRQSRKSRRQGSGSTESQAHVSETKKAAEAKKDPGFYSPKSSTSGIASFRDIRQQAADIRQQNARTTEEANKYGGVESLASNELSRYWSMRNAGASHETAMRNIHRAREKRIIASRGVGVRQTQLGTTGKKKG